MRHQHRVDEVRLCHVPSTVQFNLYPEVLMVRIRKSGKGIRIRGEKLGSLGYEDDIVLMAKNKKN